jgi:hypothetical protein
MGATHFVGMLEADKGENIANPPMGAPHSGSQIMA